MHLGSTAYWYVILYTTCSWWLQVLIHTPLEHTPKPLPTGYKGIPFIVGERGITCNFPSQPG